jgi:hypothetical protein
MKLTIELSDEDIDKRAQNKKLEDLSIFGDFHPSLTRNMIVRASFIIYRGSMGIRLLKYRKGTLART